MESEINIQKYFFDYLTRRYDSEYILYGMMDALQLRKGACYKRMNGETSLSLSELVTLCNKFNVSLDAIFQADRYISFQHSFSPKSDSFDLMSQFRFFLKPLGELTNSKLTYLANELPVFYYFSHKYIFNFLISVWSHLHSSESRLIIEENPAMTAQLDGIRSEISSYYAAHPVTEIWNSNMFANLYQQIIFSITIRAFKEEVFLRHLLDDVKKLVNHLHELAVSGGNTGSAERMIYLNEYGNFLNMVLYESEKFNTTCIGYDMPQFIVTYNPAFYTFSKEWIQKIRKRSVLISGDGFQYREMFFLKLEQDFKNFEEKVEKLMAVYY